MAGICQHGTLTGHVCPECAPPRPLRLYVTKDSTGAFGVMISHDMTQGSLSLDPVGAACCTTRGFSEVASWEVHPDDLIAQIESLR